MAAPGGSVWTPVNRTERLYGMVEELRARSPRRLPASELAARFEVSIRTIERDLQALLEAGVPIWSERGRNGGYALDPRTTLPPLNLTAREAIAVAVALSTTGPMPFAEAGRSARLKLMQAMSVGGVGLATALADRVRVVAPSIAPPSSDVLRVVEEAVTSGRVVDIDYVDKNGQPSQRSVEAHGLYGGQGAWNLVGWCRLREDWRFFRLDRMQSACITDEVVPLRDFGPAVDWS